MEESPGKLEKGQETSRESVRKLGKAGNPTNENRYSNGIILSIRQHPRHLAPYCQLTF